MGIGIASGLCVAGCMGSQNRLNYTVPGERVNLASRLCSAAVSGEILIDQTTADRLSDPLTGEPQGQRLFKGFDRPIETFGLKGTTVAETRDLQQL